MKKIVCLVFALLLVGTMFAIPENIERSNVFVNKNSGQSNGNNNAQVNAGNQENNQLESSTEDEKPGQGNANEILEVSSEEEVLITANSVSSNGQQLQGQNGAQVTVEVKKKEKNVTISNNKEKNQVTISVQTPSGVSISVVAGESVEVKKGEVYLVNMSKALEIYPSDILEEEIEEIEVELTSESGEYKYKVKAKNGTYNSEEAVISVKGSYKIKFPFELEKFYVNDTIIEFENVTTPVKVQLKEKEMLVQQKGEYLELTDVQIKVKVKNQIEVSEQVMYVGGKELKVTPNQIQEKIMEKTKAEIVESELEVIGEELEYSLELIKEYKLIGLIPIQVKVNSKISAENGQIIEIEKPWWSFLSTNTIELEEGESIIE